MQQQNVTPVDCHLIGNTPVGKHVRSPEQGSFASRFVEDPRAQYNALPAMRRAIFVKPTV